MFGPWSLFEKDVQYETSVTEIEGDFGQEIGSDMRVFLPTSDARIPILSARWIFHAKMLTYISHS